MIYCIFSILLLRFWLLDSGFCINFFERLQMKKCAYCNTTILFRGREADGQMYCNDECVSKSFLTSVANGLPEDIVNKYVSNVHSGACPKCKGRGPVDIYKSHSIYSLLLFTSWKTQPHICCRSCATKKQISAVIISLLIGWWGFPWGLIMTPVQVIRNLIDIFRSPDPSRPSKELQKILRYSLAGQVMEEAQQRNAQNQAAASWIRLSVSNSRERKIQHEWYSPE